MLPKCRLIPAKLWNQQMKNLLLDYCHLRKERWTTYTPKRQQQPQISVEETRAECRVSEVSM